MGGANDVSPVAPKLLTLLIVVQKHCTNQTRVLLGKKKRGFGEGYFNGFGGKVEQGESVFDAAVRELKEEAGVEALDAELRGVLTFHFDDNPQPWEVHVFRATSFAGVPEETDEMAPCWFDAQELPYDNMWADDQYWYPLFLKGSLFKGEFFFTNTTSLVDHTLEEVADL